MAATQLVIGTAASASPGSEALVVLDVTGTDGRTERASTVSGDLRVGPMAVDRQTGVLYCTDERTDDPDVGPGGGGRVFAFDRSAPDGGFAELNHRPSYGALASSVCLDGDGEHLLVTNHAQNLVVTDVVRTTGGAWKVVPRRDVATTGLHRIAPDGSIGELCDLFVHPAPSGSAGSGQAHPHSVARSPVGEFFVVCDKGGDRVHTFRIDHDRGVLVECAVVDTVSGSAPRYSAFHPTAPWVFVNHERGPTVDTYRYDADSAQLELVASARVAAGDDQQSDILVDAAGTFVYTLVRGADELVVLEVDAVSGELRAVQAQPVGAASPRAMAVSSDLSLLWVVCSGSDELVAFTVASDGRVAPTGQRRLVPGARSIIVVDAAVAATGRQRSAPPPALDDAEYPNPHPPVVGQHREPEA